MNTWSDGVVESWSGGSIRIKAVFQYSNIPIPRLRLCLTLCALLYALCTSAAAQQDAKIPRLGYLTGASLSAIEARKEGFRQGLRELGYEEGRNIFIDWRSSEGKTDRNSALAADLVRLKVDMIVTGGSGDTRAAKKATATIPIVMAGDGDPVGNGFVASLARPGGNITGLATLRPEISGKGLELLKEIVPRLSRLAVFVSSSSSDYAQVSKEIELAAGPFGMKPQFVDIRDRKDVEAAFRTARRDRADAVLFRVAGPYASSQRPQIAELAVKSRLAVIYERAEYVAAGGLVSYGVSEADLYRRAAVYVDKILKGAKPADLPVEQPTKFELVINLKAAKQIGLTIPPNVLARADKVIR
jgi:putative ABC transport system substrate-binding protein